VIIWALWYMFAYVPLGSWSQTEGYQKKVEAEAPKPAEAPAAAAAAAAAANPYKGSAHEIVEGRQLYEEHCAACHGEDAKGGIGPALTGVTEYIYGGSDKDLLESVMEGRPGGMPPFKSTLGEKKSWEVLAYIDSLSGK